MHYVMIGHSFASTFAVESIRKIDRQGRITVIGDEPHRLYQPGHAPRVPGPHGQG